MSRISNLISALCGEDYQSAQEIYEDIKANGTAKELQSADKAFAVL